MKFFTDQDVYGVTVRFLRDSGKDLLREAEKLNRIFVTRDRDFGSLVFVEKAGNGFVYPRILPSTVNAVHEELARIIRTYSEKEMSKAFIVLKPGRYRFRTLRHDRKK